MSKWHCRYWNVFRNSPVQYWLRNTVQVVTKFGPRSKGDKINVTSNQRAHLDYAVLPNVRLDLLLSLEQHMGVSTHLICNMSLYWTIKLFVFRNQMEAAIKIFGKHWLKLAAMVVLFSNVCIHPGEWIIYRHILLCKYPGILHTTKPIYFLLSNILHCTAPS